MRRLRWVLAVALVGGLLTLPARAALAPCGPGGSTDAIGAWIGSAPNYPSGHGETTFVASPAFDPNLMYASNGSVVMRSRDAGCGWKLVYSAAEAAAALPDAKAEITALTVPSSANNSRFVYVGVTSTPVSGVSAPSIAVSSDQGEHFVLGDSGLPLVGAVTGLAANAQVPQVAYATVALSLPTSASQQVFATNDGGATWEQRTPTGASFDGQQLTTHPTIATDLYAVDGGTVVRSSNGGASFEPASPGGPVGPLSGAPGAGGMRLLAGVGSGLAASTTRGDSWASLGSPVRPVSVAAAPLQSYLAVSGAAATYMLLPAPLDITPPTGAPRSLTITAPTQKGFAVTGLLGGMVVRIALEPNGRPIQPTGAVARPILLLPPGPVTQFPSLITPSHLQVSLAAGETRLVPYRLVVPRTPTPVDVLFAVDSTNSMAAVIESLRSGIRDIINTLDSSGLNARIGVGDFRDYPAPKGPAARGDFPWRLDRAIGPVDAELEMALNSIYTGGGTGDGGTSAYAALFQSTTGSDIEDGKVVPVEDAIAGYRKGSLRLAMVSSDAKPHEGGVRGEPGANEEQVIAALLKHKVHAMGLAVTSGETSPLPFMRAVAEGSQTFAPPGGVDCDGNGVVDLEEGAALVCRLTAPPADDGLGIINGSKASVGITAAVVGLAAGIPDLKPVGINLANGGAFAKLHATRRTLNLRADNELPFQLELHCPVGQGSRQQIGLVGATGSRVLVTDSVDLTCGGIPLNAPAAAPPAALAAPAPAPAQPVTNAQPNPNPNPNPNPAPNINVNPGVADQTEQMPQLAMAESDESSTEVATMSGLAFVAVAGLLTCTAGGLALRRREELSLSR